MRIAAAVLSASVLLAAGERKFAIEGRLSPEHQASVTVFGATTAFSVSKLTDGSGRFRIDGLDAGSYTISVFVPGRGDIRRTVDVGPGTANAKGRVEVTIPFDEARATRMAAPFRYGIWGFPAKRGRNTPRRRNCWGNGRRPRPSSG